MLAQSCEVRMALTSADPRPCSRCTAPRQFLYEPTPADRKTRVSRVREGNDVSPHLVYVLDDVVPQLVVDLGCPGLERTRLLGIFLRNDDLRSAESEVEQGLRLTFLRAAKAR